MKVGHTNELSNSELPRHREDAVKNAAIPVSKGTEETDKLDLSQSSKLEASIAGQEVRADVVAIAKTAIDDGAFKVDANKVATRLIHETASLLEVLTAMPGISQSDSSSADNNTAGTPQNSQEKFGAGPATERKAGPDR